MITNFYSRSCADQTNRLLQPSRNFNRFQALIVESCITFLCASNPQLLHLIQLQNISDFFPSQMALLLFLLDENASVPQKQSQPPIAILLGSRHSFVQYCHEVPHHVLVVHSLKVFPALSH